MITAPRMENSSPVLELRLIAVGPNVIYGYPKESSHGSHDSQSFTSVPLKRDDLNISY